MMACVRLPVFFTMDSYDRWSRIGNLFEISVNPLWYRFERCEKITDPFVILRLCYVRMTSICGRRVFDITNLRCWIVVSSLILIGAFCQDGMLGRFFWIPPCGGCGPWCEAQLHRLNFGCRIAGGAVDMSIWIAWSILNLVMENCDLL